LKVKVGDILIFSAAGGQVRGDHCLMKMLGVFVSAVVGTNGDVLSPAGPPNVVVFHACRAGSSTIELLLTLAGMPSEKSETRVLEITVTE